MFVNRSHLTDRLLIVWKDAIAIVEYGGYGQSSIAYQYTSKEITIYYRLDESINQT